jgi:hypothetical protein
MVSILQNYNLNFSYIVRKPYGRQHKTRVPKCTLTRQVVLFHESESDSQTKYGPVATINSL